MKIPQEVEINGKMVPLKEVIRDLMSKKECYTEEEKKILYDLEYALEKKLKEDIKEMGMTRTRPKSWAIIVKLWGSRAGWDF